MASWAKAAGAAIRLSERMTAEIPNATRISRDGFKIRQPQKWK
jgi:hypothetical protein